MQLFLLPDSTQIHEKVLTNRRGSDAHSDAGNLNAVSIARSIYEEGEDDRQREQLGETSIGKLFLVHYPAVLPSVRTNCQC